MNIPPETETVAGCILCPAAAVDTDLRFGRLLGLVEPYQVQICLSCGLRWLSPRPTAAAYQRLYAYDSYFEGEHVVESFRVLAGKRIPHFHNRLRTLERMLRTRDRPLTILEVGAATGEFAHAAQMRGHTALGYEISDGAREFARREYGVELTPGDLADTPATSVDVIHMNHVLEHLADPRQTLLECWRVLRPNGLLAVEVPQQFDNDLDRLKSLLGLTKAPSFTPYSLHHTYFFTPETLRRLTQAAGFETGLVSTASPGYTPLWPPHIANLLLRIYLSLADRVHQGGNIIEIYARRASEVLPAK